MTVQKKKKETHTHREICIQTSCSAQRWIEAARKISSEVNARTPFNEHTRKKRKIRLNESKNKHNKKRQKSELQRNSTVKKFFFLELFCVRAQSDWVKGKTERRDEMWDEMRYAVCYYVGRVKQKPE